MGKKSQTRFVVEHEGQFRRLISIREGANDDLLLVTHSQGLFDVLEDGTRRPIREHRHAIHVSPESDGNLIHRVTVHEDGTRADKYLMTNALRDGRCQPIYVRKAPHPQVLPILEQPAKGELVKLPSFEPTGCTMYHNVWITSRDLGERAKFPASFPIEKRLFRYFAVLVGYCYAPKPSQTMAPLKEYVTEQAERRSAKHSELGLRAGPAEGCISLSVPGIMSRDFNQIDVSNPTAANLSPDDGPANLLEPFYLFPNPVVWR